MGIWQVEYIGDLAGTVLILGIWQVYWVSGRYIGDLAGSLGIWRADWGSGRQIGDLAATVYWGSGRQIGIGWAQLTKNEASANRKSI